MPIDTVPCKTCGTLTPMKGTKLCDPCWETERRLEDYLRRGGVNARQFVASALVQVNEEPYAINFSSTLSHGDDEYTTLLVSDPANPQYLDLKLVEVVVNSMRDQGWTVLWQGVDSSHVFTVLNRRRKR